MRENAAQAAKDVSVIDLLTFNIMGTRMGINMHQVHEMTDTKHAVSMGCNLVHLHQKITFQGADVTYSSPKTLVIKEDANLTGIVIDQPEDTIQVRANLIRPLPTLLQSCMLSKAIWGVALIEGSIVLLIDLCRVTEAEGQETT
jgi:chemotaxis signal transduction protein